MEVASQYKTKSPGRPGRKTKPKALVTRSSQRHEAANAASANRRRTQSADNVQVSLSSKSPTAVTTAPLEQSLQKIKQALKVDPDHKRRIRKAGDKLKASSPNAVALSNSELVESPRSITPPKRGLSEHGLLQGSQSSYGYESPLVSDRPRASLAHLFKLESESPRVVIKTTKPLWLKGSMTWGDSSNHGASSRQRMAPPPESPQSGKARLMIQQRKLERTSSHDRGLGSDRMGDAVQRRRRKHFAKCAKASTQIQRVARGWIVRNRFQQEKNGQRKDQKAKEQNQQRKPKKEMKQPKKIAKGKEDERVHCSSPETACVQSPMRSNHPSPVIPSLTPLQNAMRLSLRRRGASDRDLDKRLAADLLELQKLPDPELDLYSSKRITDNDEDDNLEKNLCSMFKSNIVHATERARRRSFQGGMNNSFANLEGIL